MALPAMITRVEDRATGEVRYCVDHGERQLLGPWYDTREEAEAALKAETEAFLAEGRAALGLDAQGRKR